MPHLDMTALATDLKEAEAFEGCNDLTPGKEG